MRVAVTGATGFIGSHIAEALLADGHELTILARNPAKLIPSLQQARIVPGDLLDAAAATRLTDGAEAVLHAAAYVAEWGRRAEYFRANVEGTRVMLKTCGATGVRRFIHISSNSVYGDGTGDHVALPEETPYRLTGFAYGDSKIEAEKLVFAAHDAGRVTATAIRPGMVWGPRDPRFLPKVIDSLRRGVMVYLGGADKLVGLTHVENIVAVVRQCLSNPVAHGRAYNVDDDDRRTQRDLVRALCRRLGCKEPRLTVPVGLARPVAAAMEFAWSILGAKSPPLLTTLGVATLGFSNDVSVERAKRELGYAPPDLFEHWLDAYCASFRKEA